MGTLICPESESCFRSTYLHKIDDPYKKDKHSYYEYLFSFELKAGTYNVHAFRSRHDSFMVAVDAIVPLDLQAEIKPNLVIYLGHIDAILRKKKNDDEEQAALFPLIDAAVTGHSDGTFDVIVEDRFEKDMKLFITEYPGLQKINVKKSIFPNWIRPENRIIN